MVMEGGMAFTHFQVISHRTMGGRSGRTKKSSESASFVEYHFQMPQSSPLILIFCALSLILHRQSSATQGRLHAIHVQGILNNER